MSDNELIVAPLKVVWRETFNLDRNTPVCPALLAELRKREPMTEQMKHALVMAECEYEGVDIDAKEFEWTCPGCE